MRTPGPPATRSRFTTLARLRVRSCSVDGLRATRAPSRAWTWREAGGSTPLRAPRPGRGAGQPARRGPTRGGGSARRSARITVMLAYRYGSPGLRDLPPHRVGEKYRKPVTTEVESRVRALSPASAAAKAVLKRTSAARNVSRPASAICDVAFLRIGAHARARIAICSIGGGTTCA
jgi:hypothetical protein